jgi:hypothetical protein
MANDYNYDYRRGHYEPDYYDEPYSRGQNSYEDSYGAMDGVFFRRFR